MENNFYQFPDDFWWGSASSAVQSEGFGDTGKGKSNWDYWYEKEPNRFFNEVGPQKTCDFLTNYKEDIKRMKQIGLKSFRTSISWSRLIPDGVGAVSQQAVEFYQSLLDELIANDIKPFICLFHFDMPFCIQEKGGLESKEFVEAYVNYAKVCFNLFSDKVYNWFTFNEPIVPVEGGYLYDFHYPNVVDFKRAATAAYHTQLASAKAISEFKKLNLKSRIGIILNLTPTYPRSQNPYDVEAAKIADLFFNRSFVDPSVKGTYPKELIDLLKAHHQLPLYNEEELNIIKENTAQILGVNYYMPRRVKSRINAVNENSPFMPEWFFDNYEMPGRKFNPYRGWEIYEKGIYDLLINLKENYHNIDCYIAENGMGVENEERFIQDGKVIDDYRITFLKDHLRYLNKAICEGVNVRGYHMWTFIDNWSFCNAYKNRYGFFRLDLETQQRTIKKSGEFFKDIIENNGFYDK